MTSASLGWGWGGDASRFDGWCLRGQRAWRLLLPADFDGQTTTWREVAERHRNPTPEDGYVTWEGVTAWPASGSGPLEWDQPCSPGEGFAAALRAFLTDAVGDGLWTGEAAVLTLDEVIGGWGQRLNLGRWYRDGVGLAAPPYADSVILSGSKPWAGGVELSLRSAGLEAWPVAPSHELPSMTS